MCRGANDAIIPRLAFDSFAENQWFRMAVGTADCMHDSEWAWFGRDQVQCLGFQYPQM